MTTPKQRNWLAGHWINLIDIPHHQDSTFISYMMITQWLNSWLFYWLQSGTGIAFLLLIPASHLWAGSSLLQRQKEARYQSLREMLLIHSKDDTTILKLKLLWAVPDCKASHSPICGLKGDQNSIQKNIHFSQASQKINKYIISH